MSGYLLEDKQRCCMDVAELSLAPPSPEASTVSPSWKGASSMAAKDRSSSPEESSSKKRKWQPNASHEVRQNCNLHNISAAHRFEQGDSSLGIELHLNSSLPVDWEQCLDLKSGQMYYINRSTQRKTWHEPTAAERLDLELNISSSAQHHNNCKNVEDEGRSRSEWSDSVEMVATACVQCHMLVMVSKVSPSCPNCKYVHSLDGHRPSTVSTNGPDIVVRPITETLTLLD